MRVREDDVYVPPVAFSFRVAIDGADGDTGFQEVSGLKVELEVEAVAEGGVHRFKHQLPTGTKYSNLVLKRGVVTTASPFGDWLASAMSGGLVRKRNAFKTIVVQLLDENARPLIAWTVFGAYPLRWEHSALNAMGSEVLTETIELSYRTFQRRDLQKGAQARAA
ncbi:MAG: hypothetical protein QOJ53_384 [Sphingomonadales bacterium]|jgi:phage tail-like protein|nr:hypothetical protein [Sphingomonadales bacterium]MEA3042697.1 hypothetical protein [Sphingomonadales bacterium]MEA3046052.1 hypothetical protein [Sphingomonadales bacterium]